MDHLSSVLFISRKIVQKEKQQLQQLQLPTLGVVEDDAGEVVDPKQSLMDVLGRDVDASLPVLLVHLLHHVASVPCSTTHSRAT